MDLSKIKLKDCFDLKYERDENKIILYKILKSKLIPLLVDNYRDILNNLPSILNRTIQIDQNHLRLFENSSNDFINFLITRRITLADLYTSFERINLDEGLLLLGKQETDIKIVIRSPNNLHVKNGAKIELFCEAKSFPRPTYTFYDNKKSIVSNTNKYIIENARQQHSGEYKCVISQKRRNNQEFYETIYFRVKVEKDDLNEKLKAYLEPDSIEISFGKTAKIECILDSNTHINDLNDLKFEWFKLDQKTKQNEFIKENTSSKSRILEIKNFNLNDTGLYTCQVTRESTNEKILSINSCQLSAKEISEFDMKIALLIGNGNYEKDKNIISNCIQCNHENKWMYDLDIYASLERLKEAYEQMGYIVLAFVDLNADDFLRVIKLFKKICDKADRVSVLVHVIGHGHNYNHHDFLLPIDTKLKFHNNKHKFHGLRNILSISNLHNLLENFITDLNLEPNKKFYVVCFWDLCRNQWSNEYEIETNCDIDLKLNNSMEYTVIFGCLAGKSDYFLTQEIEKYNLKRGSIFTNLLLNNLKKNLSLYEIAENINLELELLKQEIKDFEVISNIKMNSTLKKVNIWLNANNNKEFNENIVDEYYLSNESNSKMSLFDYKNDLIAKYYFTQDSFLNSVKLEIIFVSIKRIINLDLIYTYPLNVIELNSDVITKKVFRITNLFEMYSIDLDMKIQLNLKLTNNESFEVQELNTDLTIPNHFREIYFKLNSNDINEYVNQKKRVDIINDDLSVSSIDDYQFDTTSYED